MSIYIYIYNTYSNDVNKKKSCQHFEDLSMRAPSLAWRIGCKLIETMLLVRGYYQVELLLSLSRLQLE